MPPIVTTELKYGFSLEDCVTLRKAFNVSGDVDETIFGSNILDIAGSNSVNAPIKTVASFWANYLYILAQVCKGGIQPLECSANVYEDADDDVPAISTSFDLAIMPNAYTSGNWGPRGKPFIGLRQFIPVTQKTGWLRWYYIAKELNDLPTQFPFSSIPEDVEGQFRSLSNFGNPLALDQHLAGYIVQTGVLSTEKVWTPQSSPTGNFHFGIRNG